MARKKDRASTPKRPAWKTAGLNYDLHSPSDIDAPYQENDEGSDQQGQPEPSEPEAFATDRSGPHPTGPATKDGVQRVGVGGGAEAEPRLEALPVVLPRALVAVAQEEVGRYLFRLCGRSVVGRSGGGVVRPDRRQEIGRRGHCGPSFSSPGLDGESNLATEGGNPKWSRSRERRGLAATGCPCRRAHNGRGHGPVVTLFADCSHRNVQTTRSLGQL